MYNKTIIKCRIYSVLDDC